MRRGRHDELVALLLRLIRGRCAPIARVGPVAVCGVWVPLLLPLLVLLPLVVLVRLLPRVPRLRLLLPLSSLLLQESG